MSSIPRPLLALVLVLVLPLVSVPPWPPEGAAHAQPPPETHTPALPRPAATVLPPLPTPGTHESGTLAVTSRYEPVRAHSAALDPRFGWPLSPDPPVTRNFDPPATSYGSGHRGVDLGAAPGQPVLAAGEGVVVFSGTLAGRGVVSIDHDGGLRTTYEPLVPGVVVGDQVFRGQVIGEVVTGHPGCPAAACLHWGVRRGAEYLNPLRLVGPETRFRLKPWSG
ncbi:Peptidase family M23 [Amycolatopsis arida]|uniref:Peptidase family M23 n=1 Tax=Amycolatopsis arida TaxID=587909 RepID=A0A1I5KII2_9PSEU|nr:M23 family metallopeptidase [Amycolatopsis arida]TDX97064.1 peptidase M23-like protein [Amycolatopsis arida]SFO84860.1 Peptidase family M23 [Amycolatopsis arida]